MSWALLHACDRSDSSPSTPGTGHLWRPLNLLGTCSCPAHHQEYTTEGLVRRGGRDLFFSPGLVDNMPRRDAFGADELFILCCSSQLELKRCIQKKRTYTCKHLTTTGFSVCLVFWVLFVCLWFFCWFGFLFCLVGFFLHKQAIFTPLSRRKRQEWSLLKNKSSQKLLYSPPPPSCYSCSPPLQPSLPSSFDSDRWQKRRRKWSLKTCTGQNLKKER